MRLVTVTGTDGRPFAGVLAGDRVLPVADVVPGGPVTMLDLLDAGPELFDTLARGVAKDEVSGVALAGVTLLAPLPRPRNIVAIGRNYREHAGEEGLEPPEHPAIFLKHSSSVVGPDADIVWDPDYTGHADWEAELGVVIGRPARRVSVGDALSYVAGYTCVNDVSARDLQFGDLQWARGKSLETFCPVGPALVTPDEIGDDPLAIRCVVNGQVMQEAKTSDMYHSVAEIISWCSHAFTLAPGDLIATGTPGGVGAFRNPPVWLGDGDEVVVEIERVGRLVNRCRAPHRP
jgi:2-keto-4-pentenoate hydratase/2-oxohepta-3-ene-1,7-dioic acid hydratase in catechol pathway